MNVIDLNQDAPPTLLFVEEARRQSNVCCFCMNRISTGSPFLRFSLRTHSQSTIHLTESCLVNYNHLYLPTDPLSVRFEEHFRQIDRRRIMATLILNLPEYADRRSRTAQLHPLEPRRPRGARVSEYIRVRRGHTSSATSRREPLTEPPISCGLSRTALEMLQEKRAKGEDCAICLSEMPSGTNVLQLPCGHEYHIKCIKRWLLLNNSCPVDRKNIIQGLLR